MDDLEELISIIIPIYNGERYLDECLMSVVNQLYSNLEIICIDDGSVDDSLKIAQMWQKKDKRVKVISQKNSGVAAARNRGIGLANGEFVLFVDCDDMLALNAVNILYECGKTADIVIGKMTHEPLNINDTFSEVEVEGSKMRLILLNYLKYNRKFLDNPFSFSDQWGAAVSCGRLYRKSILIKNNILYPNEIILGEDVIFNLEVYTYAKKCVLVDIPLYYYRPNELSVTSNYQPKRFINTLLLSKKVFELIDSSDSELLKAAEQFVFGRVVHCYTGYFFFVKDRRQRIYEEEILLKDTTIYHSIRHARVRYCAFGKSIIPLMIYIKIKVLFRCTC